MRDVLTGLAVILVLLLTGALLAPLVLDVESRRGEINTWLSKASGYEIAVTGPIGFELLPTPAVKLGHVSILTPEGDRAAIGRLKAKASIAALLRGEIRITEALVQGADLRITERLEGGAQPVFFPDAAADAAWSLAADRLDIDGARFSFVSRDGREVIRAEQIGGTMDGASLAGPFKGSLAFSMDGSRRTLRFSTGKAEKDSMRLRLLVESEVDSVRADFDGVLRRTGSDIEIAGQFNGSGNLNLPFAGTEQHLVWRLAGQIAGQGRQLKLEPAELSLGSGERQVSLPVRLGLDLTRDIALDIAVAARRLDLDRLLSTEGRTGPVAPESLLPRLTNAGGALALPPWLSLAVDISATSLLIGGDVIQSPRLKASYKDRQWQFTRAEAELPGQTMVSVVDGTRLSLESRDIARLQSWALARAARPMPIKRLRIDGALALGADGTRITGATVSADDMRLTGDIGIEKADGRPLLKLRLAAEQLDVAKLPDFG
ncbi:MAG: AsmA family protein, partial [Beijerinckiaceae bacterium]